MHDLPKSNPLSSHTIPTYSVDWRFLLPLDEHTRVLVVCNQPADYDRSFFELGMTAELITSNQVNKVSGTFGVIAAPLGFEDNNFRIEKDRWADRYQTLLQLLHPGGSFLVGLSNRWSIRKRTQLLPSSSIFETRRILRMLGIDSFRFFGVLPEPLAPEFIFPLSGHALSFALNHRYQHKLPQTILLLAKTSAASLLLNFLPFYYVVAQVGVS